MSCLGEVLDRLRAREPQAGTIVHIDYHEEDISLDPRDEDRYIPSGAGMHINWATWLGRELDDDDMQELWVYVDRDGWDVMRVGGPEGKRNRGRQAWPASRS